MSHEKSELELVTAAQQGDRAALGHLMLAHYDRLARYLTPRMSAPLTRTVTVEDIIQQAFADAFRDINKFQCHGNGAFYAWLKTIAEHRLQDAIKQTTRKKRGGDFRQVGLSGDDSANTYRDLLQMLSGGDPTASQLLARQEGVQAIQIAIAELPEDYREALRLRYFEQRSIEETAVAMGRTPAAIRSLTDRAKKRLREVLGSLSLYISRR